METPFQHMETLRQLSEPQNIAEHALLQRQVSESFIYLHKTLLTDPSQLQPCAGLIAQLAELSLKSALSETSRISKPYGVFETSDKAEISETSGISETGNISLCFKADEVSFLKTRLSEAIADWQTNPQVSDSEMAYPLLVHSMLTNEPTYERKAQRIINKAYKTLTSKVNQINHSSHITTLYTVTTLKTYVTSYSRKKITSLLNLVDCHPLTPDDNLKLQILTTAYR